ncbi:MAG: glycosyltransferase, partial [Candidatus Methylumidiphilus sp.]
LMPLGYKDFLHLADRERALAYCRQLWPENQNPNVDEFESCCYLGVNYLEWVETYGEETAAQLYQKGGRRSFLPLKFIGNIIDFLQPSVVVSTSSPRSEQAAIEAAVQRGIPTLTMLDVFANPKFSYLYYQTHADRITVPSELAGRQLLDAGIDQTRIRVTGCPAYESLSDPTHISDGIALKQSLGWSNLSVVLWAGSIEEDDHDVPQEYFGTGLCTLVEKQLRNWVQQHPNVAMIVRYHPNQYHLFPDFGHQERVYVSNPTKDKLYTHLHAADTVIVQTSTVGFEAAVIGKRLLSLSFSPRAINTEYDFSKLGLAESVHSIDHLTVVLDQPPAEILDMGGRPPVGLATPRVVAEILNLLISQ